MVTMEVEKSPQKVTEDQTLTVGGECGSFYTGLLHLLCSSQIPVPTSQGDTNISTDMDFFPQVPAWIKRVRPSFTLHHDQ